MNRLMSRLSIRLALPLAAVFGMLTLADPLPPPTGDPVAFEAHPAATGALRIETERLRDEAQAQAEARARAAAASMRWMLTSPAAGRANRCLLGSCRES